LSCGVTNTVRQDVATLVAVPRRTPQQVDRARLSLPAAQKLMVD
jgi:hypothetical protein